jgi:hypothetical protein
MSERPDPRRWRRLSFHSRGKSMNFRVLTAALVGVCMIAPAMAAK